MSKDQATAVDTAAATGRRWGFGSVQEVLFKAGPFIALLILVAYLSFATNKFLSFDNFANVGRQTAPLAILAIGQTFVILTGGIDLSVAAVAAFSSAVSAVLLTMPLVLFGVDFGFVPVPMCIAIGLLTGLVAGLLNGWVISTFKIPDFIATLGTMQVFRGVALLTTSGQSVPGPDATRELPDGLVWAGSGHMLGIPVSVFLAAGCAAIAWYILKYTTLGRAVFAVGGNREAARVCGISIGRTKLYVYAISGLLSAVAGLILVGRLSSANALLGEGMELHAIASVVIGGTNLFGGEGGILGSIVGAVLIGVLGNGLNLLGVSPFYQRIAQGLVVVVVVVFDQWRRRSASKA